MERVPEIGDRRVTNLRVTMDGRRALARATVGHVAEVRRIFFAQLDDDDLDDLRRIGGKLFTHRTAGQGSTEGPGATPSRQNSINPAR